MYMGYLYLVHHGSTGHMLADHVDCTFKTVQHVLLIFAVTLNISMCVYVCVFCIIICYNLQVYYTLPH